MSAWAPQTLLLALPAPAGLLLPLLVLALQLPQALLLRLAPQLLSAVLAPLALLLVLDLQLLLGLLLVLALQPPEALPPWALLVPLALQLPWAALAQCRLHRRQLLPAAWCELGQQLPLQLLHAALQAPLQHSPARRPQGAMPQQLLPGRLQEPARWPGQKQLHAL